MLTKVLRTAQRWPWAAVRSHATTVEKTGGEIFSRENVSFGSTSISEFIRAILVLRICSLPGFADNAEKVLGLVRKCFGKRLFAKVMRATAYGQFVAGDTFEEIKRTTEKINQCNVTQILAVPIEDVGGSSAVNQEELFEENTKKVLSCINTTRDICSPGKDALMQLKLTAVMSYDCLVELSAHLDVRRPGCDQIAAWFRNGCSENTLHELLPDLPRGTVDDLVSGGKRLLRIIKHAENCDVYIFTDAEYTWINPAIQYISIALMMIFNTSKPTVSKTYQGYLKETKGLIRDHARMCEDAGVFFGFKLVRGAYLLSETVKHGSHPPWLCDNWDDTNRNYNDCLRDALVLDVKRTRVLLATHNEESVKLAVNLLRDRRIPSGTKSNVAFAQLYGMGDYMSYTLGRMGYDIYKSLPYGNVEEVLPYLCRRAKENTLFLSGIRKEMDMLKIGLRRNLMNGPQINANEDVRDTR